MRWEAPDGKGRTSSRDVGPTSGSRRAAALPRWARAEVRAAGGRKLLRVVANSWERGPCHTENTVLPQKSTSEIPRWGCRQNDRRPKQSPSISRSSCSEPWSLLVLLFWGVHLARCRLLALVVCQGKPKRAHRLTPAIAAAEPAACLLRLLFASSLHAFLLRPPRRRPATPGSTSRSGTATGPRSSNRAAPCGFLAGGHDWSERLPTLVSACRDLPARRQSSMANCACPCPGRARLLQALGSNTPTARRRLVFYCFDVMHLNGTDLRGLPLIERKRRLARLAEKSKVPNVFFVEHFADAAGLFQWCERLGLEGIVSKRANSLYHSGKQRDWRKVSGGLAQGQSEAVEVV